MSDRLEHARLDVEHARLRLQVRKREGGVDALLLLLVPHGQKLESPLALDVNILHPREQPPPAQLREALAKHAYELALAAPLRHEHWHGVEKLVQVGLGLERMEVDQIEHDLWRVFSDTCSIYIPSANATPNTCKFGLVGVHAGVLLLLLVDMVHDKALKNTPP
ncbi:hypothetical protein B484DRAFT_121118, partial [Ochromonadaceae sp. CCMP2298]